MRLAWEQAQSAITGRQRSGFNASHSHPVPCQCLVLPHECPGNRHISFVLAARGEHVRELSQRRAGDGIPVVSRALPPQVAWPGPGGHCQGLPGRRCQHPSRKKQDACCHRSIRADGHPVQSRGASSLDLQCTLGTLSALPCQCQGPWLPQPTANPVTTGDLGLIPATAELLCPDLGRGIGIHCSSVLHWTECRRSLLLQGVESQAAPWQLVWWYPAMPFICSF